MMGLSKTVKTFGEKFIKKPVTASKNDIFNFLVKFLSITTLTGDL